MAFVVGMNLVTSADSASPSGTSIPVTKGGTGATDKTNALKNLLPDLAGNDGKVLGLNSGTPQWVEQNSNSYMFPDYSAMENTNLITTNGGTWEVDRVGFIEYVVEAISTDTNGAGSVIINNKVMSGLLATGTPGQLRGILPVSVGDVVKILTNNAAYIECKFIPPKYSTPPQPIVVDEGVGGSYSLSEVQTAETWINGEPIYKRTFTGTFTAGTGITNGTWITLPFSVGANNQLIDATLVGQNTAHTESVKVGDLRFRLTDKTTGNILIYTETQYIGITDYVVTVKYTRL